jgi:hypothetical protein
LLACERFLAREKSRPAFDQGDFGAAESANHAYADAITGVSYS